MYKALIIVCLAVVVLADDSYNKKDDGYGKGNNYAHGGYNSAHIKNRHREAGVNHYNGLRQSAVNAAAEHYGASSGTAKYYGVPGTGVGYGGYGNAHNAGYGKAHNAGYGNAHNAGYGAPHGAGYGGYNAGYGYDQY